MRGLLAIEPLYHQIVAGNKTQTRRSGGLEFINENPDQWVLAYSFSLNPSMKIDAANITHNCQQFIKKFSYKRNDNSDFFIAKPRYKIGEVLYLKEPIIIMGGDPVYKFNLAMDDGARNVIKWHNKLFMPASAARAFIKITGIRCERLFDISNQDAIAEGIEREQNMSVLAWKDYRRKGPSMIGFEYPTSSFFSLYRFANKIKPDDDLHNIWVWAYNFEYLKDYRP